MTQDPEDGRKDEAMPGLRSLAREESPPAALEARVMASLRREGLLASGSRRTEDGRGVGRRRLAAAAALVVAIPAAFAAGMLAGSRTRAPADERAGAAESRPRFMLLLLEDASYENPAPGEMEGRVSEYASWARELTRSGIEVSGEKLGEAGIPLGPPRGEQPPIATELAGFFIVSAADAGEAAGIARGCPHLKHGGRIVVRPIEPT
jgi:hypothetical protein